MKTLNQQGFTLVAGLITLAVVVVLTGIGGYVYLKGRQTKAEPANNSMRVHKSADATQNNDSSNNTKADTFGYLVIKEWRIKLKLADADKLTYTLHGSSNRTPNADSTMAYVTLQFNSSVNVPSTCQDGREIGVSIVQATAATNAIRIGNYFYGFEGGVNECGDTATDTLKQKIFSQELILSAIMAE